VNKNELMLALSGVAVNWLWLQDDGTPARYIHRTTAREVWTEQYSAPARTNTADRFIDRSD
jgi:hypothetical protein